MDTTLDRIRPGTEATVLCINTRASMRERLEDYGLISQTRVICRYRSPDGGVTALAFRGTVVAVRTRELRDISVQV